MRLTKEQADELRKRKPELFADESPPRHLVSDTQREQASVDEPVAEVPREAPRQGRLRICVTSYRLRLADEDNLALGAKPLVDCIVAAGIVPSDSPLWCKIEHRQEQVNDPTLERTEVLLENL
jgi:hypothetical protein